ncbi:MAG TPA: UDP-N-acetylmuramoyl-tripeptide--D-alanyl-D-alanine ligase [Verrucomicrobiae bacterium]|nr:UDP-N-acetylmuramoyl-tripeptide--D-alanyl-D-alanine ligase [Verrucomicrobiae bacterium]
MEPRRLSHIAEACAGKLRGKDARAIGVSTDSRTIKAGDVFFAIKGDKFDGHDYVPKLIGAAAVVVERPVSANCPVIEVANVRAALGKLGARYRADFALPVIAVAGSNGKTTTKEVLGTILQQKFPTIRSEASFNNDIGVPLTLLRMSRDHGAAVLEVGTNHPGELAPLVRMVQPKYGIVTSIGREHLEFFGDVAGVAQEEGWLAELLPENGKLFIGQSEWTETIAHRTRAQVVRVGYDLEFKTRLLGRHQRQNVALAVAVARELGLSDADIQKGLDLCKPAKMRLELWDANGIQVLDDSYNANADSMLAALHTLTELPARGRRVAILGDMAELGQHTEAAHVEVGKRVAELGIDLLVAVGKHAAVTLKAAGGGKQFHDVESACSGIPELVQPGDLVLLKASRAMRIERIGEVLGSQNRG